MYDRGFRVDTSEGLLIKQQSFEGLDFCFSKVLSFSCFSSTFPQDNKCVSKEGLEIIKESRSLFF